MRSALVFHGRYSREVAVERSGREAAEIQSGKREQQEASRKMLLGIRAGFQ